MEEHMKEVLIRNMTDNLPTLRCKMGISQVRLAEMIGVGRCTVTSIENHKRPMTWNMFLSLLMIFTNNEETKKLLVPMEIYTDEFKEMIKSK